MIDIKKIVEKDTIEIEKKRAKEHVSSGKLSASMLGMPIQWQILKWLGVEPKKNDLYTQLVFRRGRDVEEWLINILKKDHSVDEQIKCLYKGAVGYLDVLAEYHPIEIKSTNSMAFKHILKEGNAKKSHLLQGAFYAISLGIPEFSVCYVNTDNYQIRTFTYKAKKFKREIDSIIRDFDTCREKKEIPVFSEIERWNKLPQYCQYPDFVNKTKEELYTIAEVLYSGKL